MCARFAIVSSVLSLLAGCQVVLGIDDLQPARDGGGDPEDAAIVADAPAAGNDARLSVDASSVTPDAALAPDAGLPGWQVVDLNLPVGSSITEIWTTQPGSVYVLASHIKDNTADTPETWVYHGLDGQWSAILTLDGSEPGALFGVSETELYVSSRPCVNGFAAGCAAAEIRKYNGTGWMTQSIPAVPARITNIRGTSGDILARYLGNVLRYDGISWTNEAVSARDSGSGFGDIVYIASDEIYAVDCWGQARNNGNGWQGTFPFDLCDVYAAWGMRDGNGVLHMFAVGNNNTSNGMKVWQFNESTGDFGCKTCTQINDPTSPTTASTALQIWGSTPDDIYVVGVVDGQGRVYHGAWDAWTRVTEVEPIPTASAVFGSGPNDVWVGLGDGRLLHFAPL